VARERLAQATDNSDDAAESVALDEEFQGALQTISAAVFSLDAFYGVIQTMVTLDESDKKARRKMALIAPYGLLTPSACGVPKRGIGS
jgi:hypothetical protein